jgi:GR25 family glycosyltransferase involved in LPS biosynthesis
MKTYLITLDKNYSNTERYSKLSQTGLDIEIVPGIIPDSDTMKKYPLWPKNAIGIYLAHKSIWEIIKKQDSQALILEDDVDPLFDNVSKLDELEIPEYGILKLHHEGNLYSSAAAYIINKKTVTELIDNYVMYVPHVDINLYFMLKNNVKLTDKILFTTDESSSSNNRNSKNNLLYESIEYLYPPHENSQKSMKNCNDYKAVRLNDYELSGNQIFYLLIISTLLYLTYKNKNKKYGMSLIIFLIMIYEY